MRALVSAPAYQVRYSPSMVPWASVVSMTRAGPYSERKNSRVSICRLSAERSAGVRTRPRVPSRITSANRLASCAGSTPTRAYSAVASIQRSSPPNAPGT